MYVGDPAKLEPKENHCHYPPSPGNQCCFVYKYLAHSLGCIYLLKTCGYLIILKYLFKITLNPQSKLDFKNMS